MHKTGHTVAKSRKSSAVRCAQRKLVIALLAGASAAAMGVGHSAIAQTDITAPIYTPGTANGGAAAIAVGSDTVNLSGASTWSGSTSAQSQYINLIPGYNSGFITGGVDPNGRFTVDTGSQSNGIAVFDPITQSYTTVSTYASTNLREGNAGGIGAFAVVYSPTPAGQGPFVGAQIANVAGGGTLNVNLTGAIGNTTVKNTIYVNVTDGSANWNSVNSVSFAMGMNAPTAAQLQPFQRSATLTSYNDTFSLTDAKGNVTSHTVTDLASFRAYNDWLVGQLQAGNLGSGAAAQTNYNNALARAYTNTSYAYTINPQTAPIDITDPLLIPVGTRIAMLADGVDAVAHIGASGGLIVNPNSYDNVTMLAARNGGTAINDGLVQSLQGSRGVTVESGGHFINNGVRTLAPSDTGNLTAPFPDTVTGAGSTYVNNGTVNYAPMTSTVGNSSGFWLAVYSGSSAVNHGAVNLGTLAQQGQGRPTAVTVEPGGSFVNDSDGLIYLGRAASTVTTGDPMARGGADVRQSNGAVGIIASGSGATADNKGTIIIGDLVQNGFGLVAGGTGQLSMVNSGTIEVRGHYNATPISNVGIYSTNTNGSAVVNNSGTINLTGVNGVGIRTAAGGKAQSSGVINITAGADVASGLRNYGVWSEGAGSLVTVSGKINLVGDGAIGVHARSSGGVAVSGDGAVVFSSGTNQIGYFVYGAGASITNTGTGPQNVSTEGSVLFRMEDGADFTGGAGATSTLTASGKGATAVVVTGVTGTDVSAFNSGGMTINTTGENAVAVLVEGGAQGKIASNAIINLTGAGAIAGIADGQKHALDGSASGAVVAGTLTNASLNAGAAGFGAGTVLVAGANLNSTLDGVTGYIARNGASLSNSGNIVFAGANTTGIQVLEGSTGGNSGSITIQDGGVGLIASSTGAATVLNNSGSLVLKGGTLANRTIGVSADGSAVTVNMSAGNIDLQGTGAIGAVARNGATVNLSGTATPTFSATATDQIMLLVSGAGSTINTNVPGGTVLDASGTGSTLIRLENGAVQSGVLQMQASGTGAHGIWATGTGTKVTALSGSNFTVAGTNAMAVLVQGGAEVDLKAGTVVNLSGTGTIVGTVDGNEYAIDGVTVLNTNTGSKLVSEATLTSTTTGATGFITQNAGTLINSGNITFSGANSAAIKVIDGNFINQAGNITANGVAIDVTGANSTVDVQAGQIKATDGTAAIRIGQDASLNLVGSGLGVVTASGTAHAVLVDTGAAGLVIDGAFIDMASLGSGTGNGIENKAEIAGIQLTSTTRIDVMDGKGIRTAATLAQENSGTINVIGSGVGLAFEKADGTAMSNNIDFSNSNTLTITASGVGARGMSVNHSGGGDVKNGANILVTNAAGGSAIVLNGVSTFTNTGNLNSQSTVAPVVALGTVSSVTNTATGKIQSATGTALSFDGQNSTLTNAGQITGLVAMNAGNNTVSNTGIITGTITAANGNNTVTNSGTIAGNVTLGNGTNTVTLNAGSSVGLVSGGSGINNVTVKGNAIFTALDGGIGGGNDSVTLEGVTLAYTAATPITHFETMALKNATTVTTADLINLTDTAGGVGAISIDATSKLAITAPAGYSLNHALTGTGVISATMAGASNAFSFGAGTGNAFAGRVQLGTGTFALSGANTTALTNATLEVQAGNVTSVGTGNQQIGGLAINGGKMVFDIDVPADWVARGTVTTGPLDVSKTGTVQVNLPASFNNAQPLPNAAAPLLEQDDANVLARLVQATGTVTGAAGNIAVVDQNSNVLSNAQVLDISQGGVTVAKGTYDYRATTSSANDGLYVNYGLKQIELIGTSSNALILAPAATATGPSADMSAKVVGTGDLAIVAGAGKTVSLSNTTNSYTGATGVISGTLKMANDNVLGQTSSLNVAAGATFDMAGYNQSVGTLNTMAGGKVTITTGSTLTIVDGQRAAGVTDGGMIDDNTLFGGGTFVIDPSIVKVNGAQLGYTGQLNVINGSQLILNTANAFDNAAGIGLIAATDTLTFGDLSVYNPAWTAIPNGNAALKLTGLGIVQTRDASDVTLSGNNSAFAGQFDVGTGTALRASSQNNLGTATILAEGTFNAIADTDWQLVNVVTGTGTVLKTGAAVLTVDQALASFTGATQIQAGTLLVGDNQTSSAKVGGNVSVDAGATLAGSGVVAGDVTNAGTMSSLNALAGYASEAAGTFTVQGAFTNSGVVQLGGASVGNTLTVGSWIGQGGTLVLNTVLGADNSLTDRLIVNGGTATGSTFMSIVNQNGLGALTTGDGIMVVQATNGATTDAGAFALSSRVAAGAYDYTLSRGSASSADSWYLRSDTEVPASGGGFVPDVRPEIPLNAAIMPLALDYGYAMLGTLHERVGDDFVQPLEPVFESRNVWCKNATTNFRCEARSPVTAAEGQKWFGGAWARVFADRGINDNGNFYNHGASYDYTLGGFQAGLDIFGRQTDTATDKAGIYFGYGQVAGNAKGANGGTAGSVDLDAYTIGGYWTHKANSGWYSDAVVQGTFYSADSRSILGQQLKSDGYGLIASLEGGYSFNLGNGLTIEPQAQLAYQRVSFDNAHDAYGVFSFDDTDSLRGRLGVRVAKAWNMGEMAQPRLINAWVRANVWHEFMGSTKTTVRTLGGTDPYMVSTSLGGTWGEIGAGVSGQISKNTTLFATGAYNRSLDGKDRQAWNGRLGVTVKW